MNNIKNVTLNMNAIVNELDGEYRKSLVSLLEETPEFIQDYVVDYNESRYYDLNRVNENDVLVDYKNQGINLKIHDSIPEPEEKSNDFDNLKTCLASILWSKYSAVHASDDTYPIAEDIFFETIKKSIHKDDFEISYRKLVLK